jgi:hypothetical protein
MSGIGPMRLLLMAGAIILSAAATAAVSPPIAGKIALIGNPFAHLPPGYTVEEHFLSGRAKSWRAAGAGPTSTIEAKGKAPFTTRLVVVRPTDPARFNGTVLVEWLNVSIGTDYAIDWTYLHRELLRDGYAYVAVSAQKIGIEGSDDKPMAKSGIKQLDAARYSTLTHPGDAYAYDIFSQAGRAARGDGALLGPLHPKRVLASGDSQSAFFLVTYVNAIDPTARVFDGYLIHSRFRWGIGPDASRHPPSNGSAGDDGTADRIRSDVRVPVLTFITETDLMMPGNAFLAARQPDAPRIRTWEVPGASHADSYLVAGNSDDGTLAPTALAKAFTPTNDMRGTKLPKLVNAAPQHHYAMEAALSALDRWVATGRAPAGTSPIAVSSAKPASLILDTNGNAAGGIRTPWVDVATARYTGGDQEPDGPTRLLGSSHPFDAATLARLYPGGKAEYLAKFSRALDAAIARGHILAADRAEILATAATMYP